MSQQPDVRTDPLAPFEGAVTFLSAVLLLLVLVSVPLALFGSASFVGLGDKEACAVVQPGVVPYGERDVQGNEDAAFIPGLHADARFSVHTLEVCDRSPGPLVKGLSVAGTAAPLVLLFGFLVLSRRLIRHARDGMFTTAVAARTRALGWYLLVGCLLAEAIRALADGVVLHGAVRGVGWDVGLRRFDLPLTLIVVAAGIITVGRVLGQAVVLQADVDATI